MGEEKQDEGRAPGEKEREEKSKLKKKEKGCEGGGTERRRK